MPLDYPKCIIDLRTLASVRMFPIPVCSDQSPEIPLQKVYQITAVDTSLSWERGPLLSCRHGFSSENLEMVDGQNILKPMVSLHEHMEGGVIIQLMELALQNHLFIALKGNLPYLMRGHVVD